MDGEEKVREPGDRTDASFYEEVVGELRKLRKGPGLTLNRLASAHLLLKVLAQSQGQLVGAEQLSLQQASAVLQRAFNDLGESIEAKATRNAFAIGRERDPLKLTARRADFARDYGRHADTVEAYENEGIEELARRLVDAVTPGDSQAPLPAPGDSTKTKRRHQVLTIIRTFVVNERDVVVTQESLSTIRSLVENYEGYTVRFQYEPDPEREGVITLERLSGCEPSILSQADDGVVTAKIAFDLPLREDQVWTFGYRVRIDSQKPMGVPLRLRGQVAYPYDQSIMRVRFLGAPPAVVWWFVTELEMAVPGEPNDSNRLPILANGFVEKQFPPLARGTFFGIGWRR